MSKLKIFIFFISFSFLHNYSFCQFYRMAAPDTNYYDIQSKYLQGYSGSGQDTSEGGEFREFLRWQNYWSPRLYPTGSFLNAIKATGNYVGNYSSSSKNSLLVSSNWTELGPNQPNAHSGGLEGVGRVTAIAFDPSDPADIMYVGSTDGGVWRTINASAPNPDDVHWDNLNTDQQLARLGVSTLAIDPVLNTNSQYNIYAGTGEVGAPYSYSDGVYRSEDGGLTWLPMNSGLFNIQAGIAYYITKLLIDPTNNQVMFAATSVGIYKTSNRQATTPTWTKVYPLSTSSPCSLPAGDEWMRNIEFEPISTTPFVNPTVLYASGINIVKSTSSGNYNTWSSIATSGSGLDLTGTPCNPAQFPSTTACAYCDYPTHCATNQNYVADINIAISGDNTYLYASILTKYGAPPFSWNNCSTPSFFRYSISTGLWTQITPTSSALCPYPGTGCSSCALSNCAPPNGRMAMAISPTNNQTVYIGDAPLYVTSDGGSTWGGVPGNSSHSDYHALEFAPYNSNLLFIGCDGGVWRLNRSTNACDELNYGLGIATLFHSSSSLFDPYQILIGTQDMATSYHKNGQWAVHSELWGDGFQSAMDYSDANFMYATQAPNGGNSRLARATTNTNPYFSYINNAVTDGADMGSPLAMDPINPSTLYQGRTNIWKTTNATATTPTWTQVSDFQNDFSAGIYQVLSALTIAPSNNQYIYAAVEEDGAHVPDLYMTSVGGGIGNWKKITPPNVNLRITGIAVSSVDPQRVWVSYSGYNTPSKVKETTNANAITPTWTNISWVDINSNPLPNLPANCIVYEKGSNDGIYVGTDAGVYYKNNSMNGWDNFMTGLPNASVNWLEINYSAQLGGNKIRAATFGRGLWESNLACPINTDINYTSTPNPISGVLSGFYEAENNVSFNPVGSNIYNSGTVNVRAGNSIDLITSNNNTIIFTPTSTSNVHLFIHGCDHPGNSFKQTPPNNPAQQNNATILDKPITQSDNFKFTYYPNPFTDHLHIDFLLEKSSDVNIAVYNSFGQIVKTLAQGKYEAGEQTLFFDASSLTPGVYFVKLDFGDKHYAKAVIKTNN